MSIPSYSDYIAMALLGSVFFAILFLAGKLFVRGLIAGLRDQPLPADLDYSAVSKVARPCTNPDCGSTNPLAASYCRRCGRSLQRVSDPNDVWSFTA